MLKRKRQANEILLCCHAGWLPKNGTTVIPEDTYLYIYAPLGAALSQAIPKAIASGVKISPGDLTIKRISPITLFNYGYENRGEMKGNYEPRNEEMAEYPRLYKPGDAVPNFQIASAAEDAIREQEGSNITVSNINNENVAFLSELLDINKGNICHFGGCSWIRENNDARDLVTFLDKKMEDKFTPKLSEAQKREIRAKRFKIIPGGE